jgi:recombination protein RecT
MGTQTQAVATVDSSASNIIRKSLESSIRAIEQMIPPGAPVTAQRLILVAVAAAQKNPKLLKCTPESVVLSVVQAAELGLEPGGALQHGYLVPYGAQCQFMPGYRGLIELSRRSGELKTISAVLVYERDEFSLKYVNGQPHVLHVPLLDGSRGQIRLVYATAQLGGGYSEFELMTLDEIAMVQQRSKTKDEDTPWKRDFGEMAKKTVIKRLLKRCPVSSMLARAIEIDDQQYEREESMESGTLNKAAALRQRLAVAQEEKGEVQ